MSVRPPWRSWPLVPGAVVLAAVLSALASSCSGRAPDPPRAARHLLLVSIDTLRADRLGCYGNRTVATPAIDRLAREGALATDATVHVPLTRPSHASLFTGLLPHEHGLRDNVSPPLADSIPTLASILDGAGFATGAFVASVVLSAQSGLNRGFDVYDDRFDLGPDDARFLDSVQKPGDRVVEAAVEWVRKWGLSSFHHPRTSRDEMGTVPIFAWVHLYEPHDPYDPPEPYRTRYKDRPYDGEVAWADALVGRLLSALEADGMLDDTLVVVTSDHGEGLDEHAEPTHGFFVYETTLKVPLIARGPGVEAGRRVTTTIRTIDLLPTVLDLLGVERPAGLRLSGRSVAGALGGGDQPEPVAATAESLTPLLHYGWSDLRSIREGSWKFILAPRPELYDLERDPGERTNVIASHARTAAKLRGRLEADLTREREAANGSPVTSVSPELLEQLGALGYVSAGRAPDDRAAGADPKDRIAEYVTLNRLMRDGLVRLQRREYAAAIEHLAEVRSRVDSFEANYYLGRALAGARRHREAARRLERATELMPAFAAAWTELVRSRAASGDLDGALAAARAGQQRNPKAPQLLEVEAGIWLRKGNRAEAIRAYEATIALAPRDGLARARLAGIHRDAGNLAEAVRQLREAVSVEPETASYWNSLGMTLASAGTLAEAADAFREASKRDPTDAEYAYNAGLALARQGRRDEAIRLFRQALDIDGSFEPARRRLAELKP
jgi:arylsulfatase A-like enzyme/Flp pilus assembly protein TadD